MEGEIVCLIFCFSFETAHLDPPLGPISSPALSACRRPPSPSPADPTLTWIPLPAPAASAIGRPVNRPLSPPRLNFHRLLPGRQQLPRAVQRRSRLLSPPPSQPPPAAARCRLRRRCCRCRRACFLWSEWVSQRRCRFGPWVLLRRFRLLLLLLLLLLLFLAAAVYGASRLVIRFPPRCNPPKHAQRTGNECTRVPTSNFFQYTASPSNAT